MIDLVLSLRSEIIGLLDLIRPNALCNANHPQKFVDVISRVADQPAEDDKNVVHVVFT